MMPPMSLTVLVTRTTISVEGRNIGYLCNLLLSILISGDQPQLKGFTPFLD